MELLKQLYTDTFGIEPHSIEPLTGQEATDFITDSMTETESL